jgi:hypothetical protein
LQPARESAAVGIRKREIYAVLEWNGQRKGIWEKEERIKRGKNEGWERELKVEMDDPNR